MHTKKVSFNSFFTSFRQFDFFELVKLLGSSLTAEPPEINLLIELSKMSEDYLKHTNSFILITDLKALRFLYVSPSVEQVIGYSSAEFMEGGVRWFIKNYCPADRGIGIKIFQEVFSHQKGPATNDKDNYQYTSTFRFLNRRGYYSWLYSKRTYVAHDSNNFPWVEVSIVSSLKVLKQNDNLNFSKLKYNYDLKIYLTDDHKEYLPEYLNVLNTTDLKILKLLSEGLNNKEIAALLNYTEHTIKDYRKKMLKKTWCDNTAELLTFALRNKLIE